MGKGNIANESNLELPRSKYMCKEGSIKVKTDIFVALGGACDIKTTTITANIELSEREKSRARY